MLVPMSSASRTSAPALAARRALASTADPHRRQRELVRASLVLVPGKSPARSR
jgi:hypothetical protein